VSETVIAIDHVHVRFDEHYVLQDIHAEIPEESFVALVGPNGAGKSTLLRTLLGLVTPTEGKVTIFGEEPRNVPADKIGYVPQIKTMDRSFPAQSVELVLTGLNRRWPWNKSKEHYEKALAALEKVGAAHLAKRSLSKLSGGELQRVCLARTIVRQPRLVMLDEPATGIDAVGEADMYRDLELYRKETKATVVMITHDWHVAMHHANRVLLINQKQISFAEPSVALSEENLRRAFGHIGHEHGLLSLVRSNG
jgi:zinc transport system ATP-binding protein